MGAYQYFVPVFLSTWSSVLVEDVWYQRLVPSQSPAKCGKRSWGFTAGICVSLFSFSSFWCDSASRDTSHRMHIWPVSKVESFESLLGFHSVDAGFVALVLFDFLLSSWWYSLRCILVIIHEAMEEANCWNSTASLLSAAKEEVMEDWPAYTSQGNSCSTGCALSTAARLQ